MKVSPLPPTLFLNLALFFRLRSSASCVHRLESAHPGGTGITTGDGSDADIQVSARKGSYDSSGHMNSDDRHLLRTYMCSLRRAFIR